MTDNEQIFLTTEEAAQLLRITEAHLRKLLKQGSIKGTQLHGKRSRWLLRRSDILEYKIH